MIYSQIQIYMLKYFNLTSSAQRAKINKLIIILKIFCYHFMQICSEYDKESKKEDDELSIPNDDTVHPFVLPPQN